MRVPATIKWIGLALLGLAIAAGVAIAAGNLAGQQIGISNESLTAGDQLAPAVGHPHKGGPEAAQPEGGATTNTTPTTTPTPTTTTGSGETPPATTPIEPVEPGEPGQRGEHSEDGGDSGGSGHGEAGHGGGGADD